MQLCAALLCAAYLVFLVPKTSAGHFDGVEKEFKNSDASLSEEIQKLHKSMITLYRQVMLQQLFAEERIRSEGDSGVKQVRHHSDGTRNYHSDSYSDRNRILAIHDHSNNIRTVGMGEFIGVLNGVEFRTRHNDYRLYMPHRTSKDWHAVEPIPFPGIPPQVLSKPTIKEQITEMREWFKAWRDQNSTVRDYRKYFKPILCYLEGAWITSESGKIEEPFKSDRHFIDAKSWMDLQDKIRFTAYTGRKDRNENFAFLPTTIINIINESIPQFAQWNYRILCHPISRDLPFNRFRVVDNLQSRMAAGRSYTQHSTTRAARFLLNPFDTDEWKDDVNHQKWGLLDELMGEIPGKENYQGNLVDESMGYPAYSLDPSKPKTKLNAAYYHRKFKVEHRGAMGLQTRNRGFADENLFMAKTRQSHVAGMSLERCRGWIKINGKWKKNCVTDFAQWSYAFPLEILWLTPLNDWNPYSIEYKGNANTDYGKTVTAGRRWGGRSLDSAYNGSNSKVYYRTPREFFTDKRLIKDPADTSRKRYVGVLDRNGKMHFTRSSGTRIFFPPIEGVGSLRQRYPIMPVHGEGSSVWKELGALEDIVMMSEKNAIMFRQGFAAAKLVDSSLSDPMPVDLVMEQSTINSMARHKHEIYLTPREVVQLTSGVEVSVWTNTAAGHEHRLSLRTDGASWIITKCDNTWVRYTACFDGHGKKLTVKK